MNLDILCVDNDVFVMNKNNFKKFTTENDLIIFEEKLSFTEKDFYISEEDLLCLLDFNQYIFEILTKNIIFYNEQVKTIDFNKPIGINYYTIFQGVKFVYRDWYYDFLLDKALVVSKMVEDSDIISDEDLEKAQKDRETILNQAINDIFNLMKLDEEKLAFVINEEDRRHFTRDFMKKPEVKKILNNIQVDDIVSFEYEVMRKIKQENIYRSDYYKNLRMKNSTDKKKRPL